MDEIFDDWNILKKQINADNPRLFPQEKEVWMSSLGKNIGFEQNGSGTSFSRPIIETAIINNRKPAV